MPKSKPKAAPLCRSAKTGRFVTEKYADNHKATTVKESRQKKG